MNGAIIVGGLGLAAFLWWRSQQAQAAALAAAQAAPGPGLVQKAENTLKIIAGPVGRDAAGNAALAAFQLPLTTLFPGSAHPDTAKIAQINQTMKRITGL